MTDCPKFDTCNAPICPLDDWTRAYHMNGEPVCLYLREAAKQGGILKQTPHIPGKLAEGVSKTYPGIISCWGDIRRRLERAASSPSKLARRPAMKEVA